VISGLPVVDVEARQEVRQADSSASSRRSEVSVKRQAIAFSSNAFFGTTRYAQSILSGIGANPNPRWSDLLNQ